MIEWWGLCDCKHLGMIYSSYVICALYGFYYSAFLLAKWLWRLRWTWRGGPGKLSVTRLGRKTEQAASLGAGELLGKVLSGSLGCLCCISVLTLPWLGCKTGLGLVTLGKALLPPELWVAEVAAQHRNCVVEVLVPYLMRSVGDSWLNHMPGEIKI